MRIINNAGKINDMTMTRNIQLIAFSAVIALLTGCRTPIAPIAYTPKPGKGMTIEQAKETVKRLLLEQPRKAPPANVEVTDKYIQIGVSKRNFITYGSIASAITIYYSTPYDFKIIERHRKPNVYIGVYRGDWFVYNIFMSSLEDAKQFMDCYSFLKNKSINDFYEMELEKDVHKK